MKPMNDVTKRLLIALGAVLLVSVVFVVVSRNTGEQEPAASEEARLVEHRDEEGGFSVSYPEFWRKVEQTEEDPFIRLLVAPPGTDDSMSVKVIPLPGPVVINDDTPEEEIDALEDTFDRIIDQLPGLTEVVQRQRLVVNGTPGWYYIYKFRDGEEIGLHFRYFLFQGDKEYIVTFQAFPEDHYFDLAPVWDQILATFNFRLGGASPSPDGSPTSAPASPDPTPASTPT